MNHDGKAATETILGPRPAVEAALTGADWYPEFLQKLESLRHLAPGWDSYEADPPNETALHWAERTVRLLHLMNFPPHRIAPSVEGGVAVSWRHGRKNANIECFNTGELVAATSDGTGNPRVWEIAGEDLTQALETIREYIEG